mmetsp:Transcript_35719/g.47126  ORF Transcript_35719/g.47126 Transcript_35719/m.47126 type:complete len:238 (+) Transcript_35719:145-858(+)|eukprot:CAMPEP_0117763980 /NCGR_PEP_ID=MMETSP0947-20121206/19070_1 /TAXON_ID=44440 /ORGANISM="Chattonella subsalsa, Strain CCMP2191" /LENGTH=237 /DNA_ID=CAMNT_0005586009 /DNA_START=54 /DNA_END=767 /DNA_ORIENTATION=+
MELKAVFFLNIIYFLLQKSNSFWVSSSRSQLGSSVVQNSGKLYQSHQIFTSRLPKHLNQQAQEETAERTFFLDRSSPEPTAEELTNENLVKIVLQESTDEETNFLVWKCLGYRYNQETEEWSNENTFPKWREKYPSPPDLIGVTRTYSKEVDGPVLKANQALVRSIPMEYKQTLKKELKKVGWTGYMMEGLTPNKTRRAQVTNWILFYREKLFGVSIDELIRRKEKESQEGIRSPQY